MKLKLNILHILAQMICGEREFSDFPYRSSSALTNFFMNLDLGYRHDRESRVPWTESVLIELNEDESVDPDGLYLPSPELTKVIESLLDPTYYLPQTHPEERKTDQLAALEILNRILEPHELKIEFSPRTKMPKLIRSNEEIISSTEKKIQTVVVSPSAFSLPIKGVDKKLVSVMMPFSSDFNGVYEEIKNACSDVGLSGKRADELWDNSTIIQDIVDLICCSSIVIADLTKRNPNVFYEIGIAHTLGKHVIPITQNEEDVPFDLRHHRHIKYYNNAEGWNALHSQLVSRLETLSQDL